MKRVEGQALAKLNLTLDVLGKRTDGFHDLRMVMQSITLADTIQMEKNGLDRIRIQSNMQFLPTGEKNLAAVAALRFYERLGKPCPGFDLVLEKQIPVCAGMAGGSSDAAAVLRMLNELENAPFTVTELAKIGELVGSDVPYCVMGGTALAEGRGEILTPLPSIPKCWVVVCKPPFPISTPELFAKIDRCKMRCRPDTKGMLSALSNGDLEGVARRMYNVFEDVLPQRQRSKVMEIKNTLIQYGAIGANMSGTGPTAFGIFSDVYCAEKSYESLRREYTETFLVQTV